MDVASGNPVKGRSRVRHGVSSVVTGLVSVLVIICAVIGITTLESSAAAANRAELTLALLEADLNAIEAIEWQAIGSGTYGPALQTEFGELLASIDQRMRTLASTGVDATDLRAEMEHYAAVLREEFALLRAGRRDAAAELDEVKVDPAFAAVHERSQELSHERGRYARAAQAKARFWTVAIMVLSSVLIGLLAWRGHRSARRAVALAQDAQTDHLTGLPNQRAFDAELGAALSRAERRGDELSLVLLDIDLFKRVNDLHGHQAGDGVLVDLARTLRRMARAGEMVARIGGEEFAWILPGTDEVAAWRAAERVRVTVADARLAGLQATISAGVCSLATAGSREDLVRAADAALYRAKARGRNLAVRAAVAPPAVAASDPRPRGASSAQLSGVEVLAAAAASPVIDAVQEGILVRDLDGVILQVNERLCAFTGFARHELVGLGVPYPFWPPEHVEAIAASFEQSREGVAEHDLVFRRKDGTRFPALVSTVPLRGEHGELVGHVRTIKDMTNRKRAEDADRARMLGTVRSLARAIDAKDPSTLRHSERVADLASGLAVALGWPVERVDALHAAGLVHDVGKIGVPEAILSKPGRLTVEEYEIVKSHSRIGAQIVEGVLGREQVAWVRHHHERVDGRGYPDGISGEEIPDGARLLGLADAWDAMTSVRPYSAALSPEEALAECRSQAGTQFDASAVDALERIFAAEVERSGHLSAGVALD